MSEVRLTSDPIDIGRVLDMVRRDDCGASAVFIGTIRDRFEGKQVRKVEIEAYDEMALQDMNRVVREITEKHGVRAVSVVHRTGTLAVGETVVVIAVSAPHRREAFDACREVIDGLKKTTPIWKQEFFENSSRWVEEEVE